MVAVGDTIGISNDVAEAVEVICAPFGRDTRIGD